jgi:restriction endonuclease S subunit
MLDAIKPSGHCAVVVSEGFLTWEQTSAKTLRHMLLKEANLKAVIGLPQGVFVSKSGQGPKTSILVFDKVKTTKNIWFYNIENDGFTKGANRTPVENCQMTEALELYHKYVRNDKIPPETHNSFTLSVDWLTVVDPRIKEKIRKETTANIEQKKETAKAKLLERLEKKLKNAKKAKPGTKVARFGKKEYDAEIYKFECTWQQKFQNEIAKRIDKAHSYSLNSSTYRSNLTEKQLQEWDKAVSHHKPKKNGHSLDKRYALLKKTKFQNAITPISTFDPKNAIEADIVREYLANTVPDKLKIYPALKKIDEIFKSGAKYPMVKIKDICTYEKGKFPTQKTPKGPYPFVVTAEDRYTADEYQFDDEAVCIPLISSTGHGHASMKRIHYQEGKFTLANLLFALFAKDKSVLNMKYLYHILLPKLEEIFVPLMKGTANVSMKMSDAIEVQVPLPPLDKQIEIVQKIEKRKAVIKGVRTILENHFTNIDFDPNWKTVPIGDVCILQTGGTPESSKTEYYENGTIKWLVSGDIHLEQIYNCPNQITELGLNNSNAKLLPIDSVLIALNGQGKTRATVAILRTEAACNQSLVSIIPKRKQELLPEYLFVVLRNMYKHIRELTGDKQRSGLSMSIIKKIKIPIAPLDVQQEVKNNYLESFNLHNQLKIMANNAQKKLDLIANKLWED